MKQRQIQTINGALGSADRAIKGATDHGTALGLQRNTTSVITVDKNTLKAKHDAANAAKAEVGVRRANLRSLMSAAALFAVLCRNAFSVSLGNKHSVAWTPTGFVSSLRIPRKLDDMKALVGGIATFLTANPLLERADLNITAEYAQTLVADITAAEGDVIAQVTVFSQTKTAKKAAFSAMVKRISSLTKELSDLMGPLDDRWSSFGLNKPGAVSIADVPQNVQAVLVGPNAISVKWDAAARAEYYRVWTKVGAAEEFTPMGSPADLDFTIENVPANTAVQIAVSAVNNGGESQLSKIRTVTTPALSVQ